ncbi:SOS response-associated peptidase, partial [Microbacterium esteraromaticum]
PAFLTPEAMDAWLEPVKLDRAGREDMLATLDGSSAAVASTIEQYVVGRKVNNSRTVDADDPTVIQPV